MLEIKYDENGKIIWDKEILKQAEIDEAKFAKLKDPFTEGNKIYGSKQKMFKNSMKVFK